MEMRLTAVLALNVLIVVLALGLNALLVKKERRNLLSLSGLAVLFPTAATCVAGSIGMLAFPPAPGGFGFGPLHVLFLGLLIEILSLAGSVLLSIALSRRGNVTEGTVGIGLALAPLPVGLGAMYLAGYLLFPNGL